MRHTLKQGGTGHAAALWLKGCVVWDGGLVVIPIVEILLQ